MPDDIVFEGYKPFLPEARPDTKFMKVLSNSVMPKSQILQTYNKAIIDRLRRSLLWKN